MSLWYKPIEQITFEDIEAFCQQGQAEGLRLDYKVDIPDKLPNVVAAFANSQGGLILFGIEADRISNKPIWPPKGMKRTSGIDERITAMCRDGTYPPLRPQISNIIDNPHDENTVLCVVRVDESPEAPHAVDGYIYERTGSQGDRIYYAKIDSVSRLLNRRGRIEEERREFVAVELKRATHQLAGTSSLLGGQAGLVRSPDEEPAPRGLPLRWASVIPVYPWRDLCTPGTCYESLSEFDPTIPHRLWQKVPGGALLKIKEHVPDSAAAVTVGIRSLSTKGHVFAMDCTMETLLIHINRSGLGDLLSTNTAILFDHTSQFAMRLFRTAARFYDRSQVELPGFIILAMGIHDVLDAQMIVNPSNPETRRAGKRFVDEDFGADVTVTTHEFLSDPEQCAQRLLEDLRFGFDL
jgi:hypothetical protein